MDEALDIPLIACEFLVLAGICETHTLKTCRDRAECLRDLVKVGWRPGFPLPQSIAA
jgi:hypothetical protein